MPDNPGGRAAGPRPGRELVLAGVVCGFITWIISQGAFIGIDAHHDGLMLKPAMDVAAGKRLFAETFTMYGALCTYLQALFIILFGNLGTLYAVRLSALAWYALDFAMLWLIWRELLPVRWTALACLLTLGMAPFFLWSFMPWSSVYALFFQLAALYLLLAYLRLRRYSCLFAVGMATALAFWCRQPFGIILTAAFFVTLAILRALRVVTLREAWRGSAWFAGGGALVVGLFAVILLATGSVTAWWQQNVLFIITWRNQVGGTADLLPRLLQSLFPFHRPYYQHMTALWSLLPLFSLLALAWGVRTGMQTRRARAAGLQPPAGPAPDPASLAVMSVYALASWHQYYPQTCIRHVFWAAFPMFGLVIVMLRALIARLPVSGGGRTFLLLGALAGIFGYDLWLRATEFPATWRAAVGTVDSRIFRGIGLSPTEAEFINALEKTVADLRAQYPGKRLLNLTRDPLYACYEPDNVHPVYINFEGFISSPAPDYVERIKASVRSESPLLVICPDITPVPAGYRSWSRLNNPRHFSGLPINTPIEFLVPQQP